MTTTPYGCHNRAPFADSLLVQDGWIETMGGVSRAPAMKRIPFRNKPDCSYKDTDLGKADQRCEGCHWRTA